MKQVLGLDDESRYYQNQNKSIFFCLCLCPSWGKSSCLRHPSPEASSISSGFLLQIIMTWKIFSFFIFCMFPLRKCYANQRTDLTSDHTKHYLTIYSGRKMKILNLKFLIWMKHQRHFRGNFSLYSQCTSCKNIDISLSTAVVTFIFPVLGHYFDSSEHIPPNIFEKAKFKYFM